MLVSLQYALMQEVCLEILKLTTEFAGNLRIDINPEEDRQHATQMYVDVVAIARRTKDAQDHCNAHTTAKVTSCAVHDSTVCQPTLSSCWHVHALVQLLCCHFSK